MTTALIGNIMMSSSIKTEISASTSFAQHTISNQVLPSSISLNTTLGSGNYTYVWSQSGTVITFTTSTSSSTNCTYGSLTVVGSTTIYCTVSDTWTGNKIISGNCLITWPAKLSGTITNSSTTFDAVSHTATITSINGTFSGSASVSRTDAGTSSTTITGTGNYIETLSTSVSISARALTLSSAGSTTLYYNDGAQTIGYTVGNIPAGGSGSANYIVYGITQTVVGYYTATLDANTNYSVGSPSSFVWNIENGTLVISLSTYAEPNIKGDLIYYIDYYRHNGPNNSAPTVHEYWTNITTTDFALPLQSWTRSPNGWGPDPKVVDFYIYNTTYYYNYYGSRYIPS